MGILCRKFVKLYRTPAAFRKANNLREQQRLILNERDLEVMCMLYD